MLPLALAAPIGVIGHEHTRNDLSGQLASAAWAWQRLRHQSGQAAAEQEAGAPEQEQRGVTIDCEAEQSRGLFSHTQKSED